MNVQGIGRVVFISVVNPHPMAHYNKSFSDLWLVIWRLEDGEVSFDALNPRQSIDGDFEPATAESLNRALGIKWG